MKQGNGAYIAKLAVTLLGICVVCAFLLGLVNMVTKDTIAATNERKTQEALQEVLPDADGFEAIELSADQTAITVDDGACTVPITAAYKATNGAGYVIQTANTGFGGAVNMVTGINADGSVNAISIISSSETSGLGQNASKPYFKDQLVGATDDVKVTKDGGTIKALTGATITSRCVTRSVNAARQLAAELG